MTGYTRNDTANNIAEGNIINAADLDGEFDSIQVAFDATTGHTHDGTTGEGGPIEVIGPAQDIVATTGALRPKTDNTVDLGTATLEYKDLFLDGTANIDTLSVDENATIAGTLGVTGNTTLGNVTVSGTVTYGSLSDGTITITAFADEDDMVSNSATLVPTQQSVKAYVDAQVGANNELSEVLANGNTTGGTDIAVSTGDDITFADNSKAIFGAGSDLQIFHTGSHSIISDSGTGDLKILGQNVEIGGPTGELNFKAVATGASTVYYNNSAKLATTSTGIDVTGTVTADGLTVDNGSSAPATLRVQNSEGYGEINVDSGIVRWTGDTHLFRTTALATKMQIASNGDISFYEDTGTTPKFFWDASAEALGIGTTSPSTDVHIKGAGGTVLRLEAGNGVSFTDITQNQTNTRLDIKPDGTTYFSVDNNGDISFYEGTGTTPKFFWDASAEALGIGTTTPALQSAGQGIHIHGATSSEIKFTNTTTGSAATDGTALVANGSNFTINNREAGNIQFNTNNTERMRIDGNGRVGIGTSSPAGALHVSGGITRITSTTSNWLEINATSGAGNDVTLETRGNAMIFNAAAGFGTPAIQFQTSGTERMRIDSSGNVGIGTFAPSAELEVAGDVQTTWEAASTKFVGSKFSTTYDLGMYMDTDNRKLTLSAKAGDSTGTIAFQTGVTPSEAMRIDNTGRVGIGTSSPSQKLHVYGSNATAFIDAATGTSYPALLIGGSGTAQFSINADLAAPTTNGTFIRTTGGAYPLRFGTNSTERMRIDASGNLHLAYGQSGPSAVVRFGGTNGFAQIEGVGTTTAGGLVFKTLGGGLAERMRIDSSGNVGIGTSSPSGRLTVNGISHFLGSVGIGVSTNTTNLTLPNDGILSFHDAGGNSRNSLQFSSGELKHGAAGAGLVTQTFYTSGTERMRITNAGDVGIGTTSPRTKLDIEGNFALDGDSGSTSSTTQTAIATYAAATFKGCKAVITANNGTDTYVTELLIANTASAATATEYGQVGTGTFAVTYDVDVSGGNVRVLATAPNATATTYKVIKNLM